jgi:hypothetical protein
VAAHRDLYLPDGWANAVIAKSLPHEGLEVALSGTEVGVDHGKQIVHDANSVTTTPCELIPIANDLVEVEEISIDAALEGAL